MTVHACGCRFLQFGNNGFVLRYWLCTSHKSILRTCVKNDKAAAFSEGYIEVALVDQHPIFTGGMILVQECLIKVYHRPYGKLSDFLYFSHIFLVLCSDNLPIISLAANFCNRSPGIPFEKVIQFFQCQRGMVSFGLPST